MSINPKLNRPQHLTSETALLKRNTLSIASITIISFQLLLTAIVSSSWNRAVAAEFQSLLSIRMQAENFIQQYPYESPYSPRLEIGYIDNRLKLKACPEPLQVEFARRDNTHGNTAINIGCPQASGWKLLLPVHVELFDDVLVLTRAVQKGQNIDSNLVKHRKKNISRLSNGYYSQLEDLAGLEARRNLKRGAVLTPAGLKPRLMVKSGQRVTLILDYKGIQIKSTGQALQSARRGDIIKVRNIQSSRIVEGIVSGVAEVEVNI